MDRGRRALLAAAVGAFAVPWPAAAQPKSKTRLVLLGTGGGPRPKQAVSSSAQVIVANGNAYVIDCGDGVARQLVSVPLSPTTLRHVFITHHHSDHNADYGNLLLLAWAAGLRSRVDTWGPPPIAQMTKLFLEMSAFDINTRIADEGRVPLAPLIYPHELTAGGVVMQDENVKVTAALVEHPPIEKAFAYRFDAADRSIVISGDTAMAKNLIGLAQGADVLVHEALWVPAVDRLVAKVPNASTLKEHIIASHTSAEDCGRVAAAAGVKTLVLSHLVPPDDPQITEQMWIEAAKNHFSGTVVLGKDLLEL
ncbi:MAG TPA: MBL fold metallo-hydrolase [Vicinamibacterales bacterium]|nr:MBL fold metallo-hydrolase [Vicinamibacterales bacterium]